MSAEKLRGQFLQGNIQRLKKPDKNHLATLSNNIAITSGISKVNGRVLPRQGAYTSG